MCIKFGEHAYHILLNNFFHNFNFKSIFSNCCENILFFRWVKSPIFNNRIMTSNACLVWFIDDSKAIRLSSKDINLTKKGQHMTMLQSSWIERGQWFGRKPNQKLQLYLKPLSRARVSIRKKMYSRFSHGFWLLFVLFHQIIKYHILGNCI